MVYGMEAAGHHVGPYYVPDRHFLYASQVTAQELYPQVIHTLRELAGGGVIMLPSSSADFANPERAEYIARVQSSPVADAPERVNLFNLAWDAIGSEFGCRHTSYEMFYAGNSISTRGHAYRTYDWDKVGDMVDSLMSTYDLPQA